MTIIVIVYIRMINLWIKSFAIHAENFNPRITGICSGKLKNILFLPLFLYFLIILVEKVGIALQNLYVLECPLIFGNFIQELMTPVFQYSQLQLAFDCRLGLQ